jgi:predicted alpha/beta superfamily hydrolase
MKVNCHRLLLLFFFCFLVISALAEDVQIKFLITVPKNTPASDTIFIAGNNTSAGNWDAGKVPLTRTEKNTWEITLSLPKGLPFEYKITRGKWENEAVYLKDSFPVNQKLNVTKEETVHLAIIDWVDLTQLKIIPPPPPMIQGGITGEVEYHRDFPSIKLRYSRDLIVLLPPGYHKNTKKHYPVLYMHDGQNVIDPRTSFTKVAWGIDKTVDKLYKEGKMQEIIVVGVYNSPDRLTEYSDSSVGNDYMDFLIHEVKPFIDSTYRTLPDRENTATMGSSLGGLISFLLVWKHSDVFSKAACLSSSFSFAGEKTYDMVENYTGPKKDIKIYLDHGDKGLESMAVQPNQKMRDLLISKGFTLGKDLDYYYAKGGEHNESAWAARLTRPVLFLFGKNNPTKNYPATDAK